MGETVGRDRDLGEQAAASVSAVPTAVRQEGGPGLPEPLNFQAKPEVQILHELSQF